MKNKFIFLIQIILNLVFIGAIIWMHGDMTQFEKIVSYPFIGIRDI